MRFQVSPSSTRPALRRALPALLLLPYIAWLTFATVLNAKLWQLNGASK
jgi:tryptophan-rich sensory protein